MKNRAIVIGHGSIGKRHTSILRDMGIFVRTVDVDEIGDVEDIISKGRFDFGLVCTPNCYHLKHCNILASFGVPFFCEKPLYVRDEDSTLTSLKVLVKEQNLINMVGCNLRFEPNIKKFTNLMSKSVSKGFVRFGYDLKKWHNDGKHLKSYSANKSMHGGITFDCIHEFDYIYNMFGEVDSMRLIQEKRTDVTVNTEDFVSGKVFFKSGVEVDIALDYIQEEYTRFFEFEFEDGTMYRQNVRPSNIDYTNQLKYFVNNVNFNKKCMNDVFEASSLIEKINEGILVRV